MKVFLLAIFTLICPLSEGEITQQDYRNKVTGELYPPYILTPAVNELVNFIENEEKNKVAGSLAADVALIQAITSVEETIFQLARFFGRHETPTDKIVFSGGLGMQFESIRCDDINSVKFPRKRNRDLEKPWYFFDDTLSANIHCPEKEEVPERRRRSNDLHPLPNQHRQCGRENLFTEETGSLTFPANGTSSTYSANINCSWLIHVHKSKAVLINVRQVDLEDDKECKLDYVAFYEGDAVDPLREIRRICKRNDTFTIWSDFEKMLVVFVSESSISGGGFVLDWQTKPATVVHPGFQLVSVIAVDQVGDLNVDQFDFDSLPSSETIESTEGYQVGEDFQLKFKKPTTCPLKSEDSSCYFETTPYIISKIISMRVYPQHDFKKSSIQVSFDHTVQSDLYNDQVYDAPKSCVTWDSNIQYTDLGAWSRRNGRLVETTVERTICNFDKPGIYAVVAAVPPQTIPEALMFSMSWYFGLVFGTVWVFITFVKMASSTLNIPEWQNMNQLLALLVFCGVIISGMHLELEQAYCALLGFLLYYFGAAVLVWHLLKAAQFTGYFDKFFRGDRNLYAFHLVIGWATPLFIAGMGGGAVFHERLQIESCWFAIKGGSVAGYTSPTFLIVLSICFLYYKGLKKTPSRVKIYNYPKLLKRTLRDGAVLVLMLFSWLTGSFCLIEETKFAPQFFFCVFFTCMVVMLCLYSKQQRPTYETKDDRLDTESKYEKHKKQLEKKSREVEADRKMEMIVSKKFIEKWMRKREPVELATLIELVGFEDAYIEYDNIGFATLNMNIEPPEDSLLEEGQTEGVKEEEEVEKQEVLTESEEEQENEDEIFTDSEVDENEDEEQDSDEEKTKKIEKPKQVKKKKNNSDDEDDSENESDDNSEDEGDNKKKMRSKSSQSKTTTDDASSDGEKTKDNDGDKTADNDGDKTEDNDESTEKIEDDIGDKNANDGELSPAATLNENAEEPTENK